MDTKVVQSPFHNNAPCLVYRRAMDCCWGQETLKIHAFIFQYCILLQQERSTSFKLSGCDITPSFSSVRKKRVWDTWKAFPKITDTFIDFCSLPLSDENMNHRQVFVVLLFGRTSDCTRVDQCRKQLIAKGIQIDRKPPTEAANL